MNNPPQEFSVLKITSWFDIDGELDGSKREKSALTSGELLLKLNEKNPSYMAMRCNDNYVLYSLNERGSDRIFQESYCIGKHESEAVKGFWDYILRKHSLNNLK